MDRERVNEGKQNQRKVKQDEKEAGREVERKGSDEDYSKGTDEKKKKADCRTNILPCTAISAQSRNSRSTSKPAYLNSASLA